MSQPNTYAPIDRLKSPDNLRRSLPAHWRVDVAAPERVEVLDDPKASIDHALSEPVQSPPLAELVGPGDQVCISFSHPSVQCPDKLLVPALLRELARAGVRDQDVTLLCASALLGRTSYDQWVASLGAEIVDKYRVADHDVGEVIHLGQWQDIPLTVNRCALEADLLVSTGVVAPHLYAGYSGGADTVAVGCAGDATIEAIHAPRFVYNPLVRPGQIRGNPFREAAAVLAERAGLRFILNVVLDPDGRIADVQAGDPQQAHAYLVFSCASLYNSHVPGTYDVIIAGLDPPYGDNLYQAILGALFVGMAPNTALCPGGVIVVPARTPQAVGEGINAQNFFNALQGFRSLDVLITELLERGYRPGEARAFQLARLLEQHEIIIVGSEFPAIVKACHMQEADEIDQAVELTRWLLGDDLDVLVVPHSLHTLPVPSVPDPDHWSGVALVDRLIW
jgi:nickel-dependent lactate racemase